MFGSSLFSRRRQRASTRRPHWRVRAARPEERGGCGDGMGAGDVGVTRRSRRWRFAPVARLRLPRPTRPGSVSYSSETCPTPHPHLQPQPPTLTSKSSHMSTDSTPLCQPTPPHQQTSAASPSAASSSASLPRRRHTVFYFSTRLRGVAAASTRSPRGRSPTTPHAAHNVHASTPARSAG